MTNSRKEKRVVTPMNSITQDGTYRKTFSYFVDEQCKNILTKLGVSEETVQAARTYVLDAAVAVNSKSRLLKEDRWRIDGTTCSVAGRFCNSCDGTTNDHIKQAGGGLLCAHRLAAMIMTKFSHYSPGDENPGGTLKDLLTDVFGNARKRADVVDVRMKYSKEFTYRFGEEQNIIVYGYQVNYGDPGSWVYLSPPMAINTHEFDTLMESLKFCHDFTYKGFQGKTAHNKETITAFIPFEEEVERSMAYQGAKAGQAKAERDYHERDTEFMRQNPDGIVVSSKMRLGY